MEKTSTGGSKNKGNGIQKRQQASMIAKKDRQVDARNTDKKE